MKKKISEKKFDLNYFRKFEISNTNKILGGAGCQIDNCTYSSDIHTDDTRGSNQNGGADDGSGTTDDTTHA
jgi:hypothetical protein